MVLKKRSLKFNSRSIGAGIIFLAFTQLPLAINESLKLACFVTTWADYAVFWSWEEIPLDARVRYCNGGQSNREKDELEFAPFPSPVLHLPLSQATVWMSKLPEALNNKKSVVVICHSGIRSWNFANWLIEQNWGCEVWNLDGGIDAWSLNIDSTVARY